MVFKILNIRQQRAVNPERWETKEVSRMIATALCLESVDHGRVRKNPGRTQRTPCLKEVNPTVQGAKASMVYNPQ